MRRRTPNRPGPLPDGMVLVTGGLLLATAEVYDPAAGTWTAAGTMGVPRSAHTATEVYDSGTATWAAAPPMPTARATHTATLLPDGRVLVAGGRSGGGGSILASTRPSAGLFDGGTGKWTPVVDMSSPRFAHAAALLAGGKVLVVGGLTPAGAVGGAEILTLQP